MMTDRIVRALPVAVFLFLLVLPDASDASQAKATTKVITGYGSTDGGKGGSNPMNRSVGTARLVALTAGNVPAVVLDGRETIKAVRQGFRPFRESGGGNRAHHRRSRHGADEATEQTRRLSLGGVQAVLESIRISATQKERMLRVLMKQFAIPQEDANLILDIVHRGWALDDRPTPSSQKFEFDLAPREMGLKEPPKPEQVHDFSLLDEIAKR
jgi:hypothetical protein